MQGAIIAVVLIVFLVSPNLLHALGIGYMSPAGGALEKLHPALALLLPLLAACVANGPPRRGNRRGVGAALGLLGVTLAVAAWFLAKRREAGGGELSALAVTYAMPALLALLLAYAREKTLARLPLLLGAVFLANSATGLAEAASGLRLLPFVAGNDLVTSDPRPTALLGHPLANAMLTGGWLVLVATRLFENGFRPLASLGAALHLCAMLAFGGRAALVLALACSGAYMLYALLRHLSLGRGGAQVRRAVLLTILAGFAAPVLVWSGAADGLIARFSDDHGSAQTRLAALHMPGLLDPNQLWTGLPFSDRTALQALLGSENGIELSWVALLLSFGLPGAVALLLATFTLLAALSRGRGMRAAMLWIYFVAATASSLSIGSKSLLIAQFVVLVAGIPPRLRPFKLHLPGQDPVLVYPGRATVPP